MAMRTPIILEWKRKRCNLSEKGELSSFSRKRYRGSSFGLLSQLKRLSPGRVNRMKMVSGRLLGSE